MPGYFSGTGAKSCQPCNAGSYANSSYSSTCLLCPAGTFAASNSSFCQNCGLGSYSNEGSPICASCSPGTFSNGTGFATCDLCPEGTYQSIDGSTRCESCPPGTYNNKSGTSACLFCPLDTYANTEGSTLCSTCAFGSTTMSVGSVICNSPECRLSFGAKKQNIAVTYSLMILPFVAIAIITYFTRRNSDKLPKFTLLTICLSLICAGADFVSDVLYIYFLVNGFYIPTSWFTLTLGSIMGFVRLIHPFSTFFVLDTILFGSCISKHLIKKDYNKSLDVPHMSLYKKEYALLLIISIIETPVLIFLPWLSSEFTKISGGYPDINSFKLCCWSKISQSILSAIVQIIVFCYLYTNLNEHVSSCTFSLVVTILTTLTHFVLVFVEFFFQSKNITNEFQVSNGTTDIIGGEKDRPSEINDYSKIHPIKIDNPSLKVSLLQVTDRSSDINGFTENPIRQAYEISNEVQDDNIDRLSIKRTQYDALFPI